MSAHDHRLDLLNREVVDPSARLTAQQAAPFAAQLPGGRPAFGDDDVVRADPVVLVLDLTVGPGLPLDAVRT
jgi:hypothetical protein